MRFALSPTAEAAGHRVAAFDTIDSTSQEAMRRAAAGAGGPLWVVSRAQTAGRGRRGSRWEMPEGNLAASLLLVIGVPPAQLATLGFVAGLALARALDRCCGEPSAARKPTSQENPDLRQAEGSRGAACLEARTDRRASFETTAVQAPQDDEVRGRTHSRPRSQGDERCSPIPDAEVQAEASLEARTTFRLKWPNDVLADGAKLAGILLGTEASPDGRRAVVVGIGVNVAQAPLGLTYAATSLRALGFDVTAERLFTALAEAWVELYGLWRDGDGFDAIRALWLERAIGLGGDVSVRTAAGVTRGIFETIDGLGQLVIRLPDTSTRLVTAGDVHFGLAATARAEAAA